VNGNAVTYPANVVSDVNSLVAYFYGYGTGTNQELPDVPGGLRPGKHYIVAPDGNYRTVDLPGGVTTTYVTFESDGLPLVRPLLLLPGGDILAATLEPALTEIVNAGYKDNEPIPDDPTATRPMGLLPTTETSTMLANLPGAIQQGLQDGADTAQEDFADPANFITKPIGEAAKLPGISSLTNLSQSTSALTSLGAKNAATQKAPAASTSSTDRPRPFKKFADDVKSSPDKLAKKPAKSSNDEG